MRTMDMKDMRNLTTKSNQCRQDITTSLFSQCPPHIPILTKYASFNGWGVTVYDSLDTMILMGLDGEYERARKLIDEATFHLPDVRAAFSTFPNSIDD